MPESSSSQGTPLPRHSDEWIVQAIADVWNADNEANGVETRWEVITDSHPKWRFTLSEVK